MIRLLKLLGIIIGALTVFVFASLGWLYYQANRRPAERPEYVAMGSSFAAGPGVGERESGSPTLCARSASNYAHLVARAKHLSLVDVSCGGATAVHVLQGGQYFQPPQIDALKPETRLVTVTVGGNDIDFIRNLYAWSCGQRPEIVPAMLRGGMCKPTSDTDVDEHVRQLPAAMNAIANEVHARAPHAQLLFVQYVSVLPESGQCPERLPITQMQLERSRTLAAQLHQMTAEAAKNHEADLIEADKLTLGHDVCAADPWVFPWAGQFSLFSFGPMPYHPTARAMQAVSDAILASITASSAGTTVRWESRVLSRDPHVAAALRPTVESRPESPRALILF